MSAPAKVLVRSVEAEAVAEVDGEDEEAVLAGEEASEKRTLSLSITRAPTCSHGMSCHF
jgi:hypothetical protein